MLDDILIIYSLPLGLGINFPKSALFGVDSREYFSSCEGFDHVFATL